MNGGVVKNIEIADELRLGDIEQQPKHCDERDREDEP
jgi:hypothetical protein